MKKILVILIGIFWMSSIFAQTETRELADFSTLKVIGSLEVRLLQGVKNEAMVSILGKKEEELINVKTEIVDGVLSIYRNGKSKNSTLVILTFKEVHSIHLNGASEIVTLEQINANKFSITGSGAIEADLNLNVKQLTINFSGASDIRLKGSAEELSIKSSGASDIKAKEFIAQNVTIDVSGASDIKVHAKESIKGEASGASSVSVSGNPTVRAINSGGAASITIRKQHVNLLDNDDDVDLKLGNKAVNVKNDGDSVLLKWGHTELMVVGDSVELKRSLKKRRSHWAGLDLAINGFLNSKNEINLSHDATRSPSEVTQFMELNYAKSWAFSFNFAEWYIPIKGDRFGLVTGLGTEWNNYELKYNVKLNAEGGSFVHTSIDEFNKDYTWGEVDTLLDYSKNRFKTWFVNAPLLLVLNTGDNKNKSFHLSVGAIFGFNLQTKMKYKYRLDGDTKKDKDKQSFNTNPFRVSATVRGGVGWFNLFASYSLTPLFETGRGPVLSPFTVGVTLLGF